jgi:ABC-type Fe3+/spermidine/putrescine transport system ATPase subunit
MIRIRGLRKDFEVKDSLFAALSPLDLDIAAKEFFVLLGPSGSGKSTLLRCVAGIEAPQAGEIEIGSKLVYSHAKKVFVRPEHRGLGMVFQSYAVWPHLTVYENVALPLTHGARRLPRNEVDQKVKRALALVQIENLADRPVPFLSGGQQQRVALARSLAVEPVVLLMDEPLSNLDARLREEIRVQIREVTRSVGVTVLYVTHDQTEALTLADRVAVIDRGRILQIGSPEALYKQPADRTVAEFLGQVNWITGLTTDGATIETEIGTFALGPSPHRGRVRVGMRPTELALETAAADRPNAFAGTVLEETFFGEFLLVKLRARNGSVFTAKLQKHGHIGLTGREVYCRADPQSLLIFPET